jgi:hypothetical protein
MLESTPEVVKLSAVYYTALLFAQEKFLSEGGGKE